MMGAGVVLMQCVVEVSTVITDKKKKSYKLKITQIKDHTCSLYYNHY